MSQSAQDWTTIHDTNDWGRWPPESVVSYFCRTWKPSDRRNVKVLDLGGGAGACTRFLADEGFTVTAVDCSESALVRMRYNLLKWGCQGVVSVQHDIESGLPFADSSFDVVLDNLCLTHICNESRDRVTREIARTLVPGGIFLLRRFAVDSEPIIGRGDVYYFSADEYASKSGLGFSHDEVWHESIRGVKIIGTRMVKCA